MGCGGQSAELPTAPSPSAAPSPSSSPAPSTGVFRLSLPLAASDFRNNAFGVNPFGVHIGDHGIDGHPGWDIEYAPGAMVLAAADGTVQSVMSSEGSTNIGIQITHRVDGRDAYRTIYGVGTLAPGIAAGATVTAGQPLGATAVYTRTIGRITVTYSFVHFQLDDFSRNVGLTNQNAVSPEAFLDAAARAQFTSMWPQAFYPQEFVEPFVDNDRLQGFPMSRTWTLVSGGLAARLEFTRTHVAEDNYAYVMRDAAGSVIERGTIAIDGLAKPNSTLDFIPASGPRRLGVYAIVNDTMQLDLGAAGAARPSGLGSASTYRTSR